METREVSPEFTQEIAEINKEIAEVKASLETEPDVQNQAQITRNAISNAVQQAGGRSTSREDQRNGGYLDEVDTETAEKINELVDKIHQKGLATAIAEAREQSPYILDVFHDALVEKLYDELMTHKLL